VGGGEADATFLGKLLQSVRADHPLQIFVPFGFGVVALIGDLAVIGSKTSFAVLADKPCDTPYTTIPRDLMGSAVRAKQVSSVCFLLWGNRFAGDRHPERSTLHALHLFKQLVIGFPDGFLAGFIVKVLYHFYEVFNFLGVFWFQHVVNHTTTGSCVKY